MSATYDELRSALSFLADTARATENFRSPMALEQADDVLARAAPSDPNGDDEAWYRGWLCRYSFEAEYSCGAGYYAMLGGDGLDCISLHSDTWKGLIADIDAYMDADAIDLRHTMIAELRLELEMTADLLQKASDILTPQMNEVLHGRPWAGQRIKLARARAAEAGTYVND